MSERCERIVDRLPALAAGRLVGSALDDVRQHVATCAACAQELALIRALAAHEVPVPDGLEARVRTALRSAPSGPRWASPGRLAMAATVVFALVTAGLLNGRNGADPRVAVDTPADVAAEEGEDLAAPPWPSVDEPLMRGGPALYQLSVDELETLLKELES